MSSTIARAFSDNHFERAFVGTATGCEADRGRIKR
jgi:hypothetical protein